MEKNKIEVQEFDGKEYILYNTILYNGNYFDVYSNEKDPSDIRIYKQIKQNNEIYYEKATSDEYIFVMSKCV